MQELLAEHGKEEVLGELDDNEEEEEEEEPTEEELEDDRTFAAPAADSEADHELAAAMGALQLPSQ